MKKIYFLFLLLSLVVPMQAQLNCQTIEIFSGDSTICYHQKGTVSTITFPSTRHERYYHFQAFDVNGNKVVETGYGILHGAGSLDVIYHSNGAIKSARSTFQPDGGIQHYDVTTFFKEDGTFSHEEDHSWDRQITHPIFKPSEPTSVVQPKPYREDSLLFHIKNTTNRKVKVLVGHKGKSVNKEIIIVKKNASVEIGKYLPVGNDNDPNRYFDLDILPHNRFGQPKLIWSNDFLIDRNSYLLIVLFKE
ncbi:MAG: hypothetical protein K9G40_01770 [Crocinitomicaceae bacterium]|nr:hypothetical protein [Crocinitomicaceae bacterium]